MVVTGPLLVQPIVKPPQLENEVIKAFQILKQVGSTEGSVSEHTKQMYDGYSVNNNYSQPKSYDIPTTGKSWKHADMLTAIPQQNYYFDANVAVYPVDNDNMISSEQYMPQSKYATNTPASFDKTPLSFDSPLSGKLDFDLSTLLSLPLTKEELSPDNAVRDQPLELSYDNIPTFQDAAVNDSTGIWGGPFTKENNYPSPEHMFDPFVNDFQKDEPRLYPVPSTDSLFVPDMSDQASPPLTAANSPMSQQSPWEDKQLQELFEKTFDFSDIDLILPPPPKRVHDTDSLDIKPVVHQLPSTPDSFQYSPAELSPEPVRIKDEDYVRPKTPSASGSSDKTRSKSTILFGKHEDDIIHKLLVPDLATPSRPVTRDKLVSMPVEEFNHLLEITHLNDIEVAFMKEWRRRGKNKTAAQVARKRKREEVGDLESEVEAMRQQKVELQLRYDQLRSQITSLKERSLAAESKVYKQFSKNSRQTLSRDTHLIHVTNGKKLLLVPKISSPIISVN